MKLPEDPDPIWAHPDDGVKPYSPYNSWYETKVALHCMNHALKCQDKTEAHSHQVAVINFKQASRKGIVFQ